MNKLDLSNPPEKYWHCAVKVGEKSSHIVINDLSFDQLIRNIVDPWKSGRQFSVSGALVKQGNITEIKIAHTPNPSEVYAQAHNARMTRSGIADLATDRRLIPLDAGTDMTNELLFSEDLSTSPSSDTALVLQICQRIQYSAKILSNRPRKGKASYLIEDEYDVQDLLQAVLKAYLKYPVQEDPLSKVAGIKSGRADISIEDLGIMIEVKYVREAEDQRRILAEHSEDLVLYSQCSYLKTFIFLIYNASVLRDPEAFERLSGTQERNRKRFDVKIVLS